MALSDVHVQLGLMLSTGGESCPTCSKRDDRDTPEAGFRATSPNLRWLRTHGFSPWTRSPPPRGVARALASRRRSGLAWAGPRRRSARMPALRIVGADAHGTVLLINRRLGLNLTSGRIGPACGRRMNSHWVHGRAGTAVVTAAPAPTTHSPGRRFEPFTGGRRLLPVAQMI